MFYAGPLQCKVLNICTLNNKALGATSCCVGESFNSGFLMKGTCSGLESKCIHIAQSWRL